MLVFRSPLVFAASFASASVLVFACSSSTPDASSSDGGTSTGSDGATSNPDATATSTEGRHFGRAVVAQANTPIAGAKVTAAGRETVTDAEGKYSLLLPKKTPFTFKITAADHYQLIEQEYSFATDSLDRGDSSVLSTQTANLLSAFLDGYDKSKGLLAVRVIPLAPCADEGGTVLTLDPPGATLKYTSGGIPGSGTSVKKGESIAAIFYNVPPGVPVKVKATSPTCGVLSYPVDYTGVTYTGAASLTEAGESLSFVRVFLGAQGASDAGAD
jgi:hypothetical protein